MLLSVEYLFINDQYYNNYFIISLFKIDILLTLPSMIIA